MGKMLITLVLYGSELEQNPNKWNYDMYNSIIKKKKQEVGSQTLWQMFNYLFTRKSYQE